MSFSEAGRQKELTLNDMLAAIAPFKELESLSLVNVAVADFKASMPECAILR